MLPQIIGTNVHSYIKCGNIPDILKIVTYVCSSKGESIQTIQITKFTELFSDARKEDKWDFFSF